MPQPFEPCFFIQRHSLTTPTMHGEDESFSRYLAHRVSRYPGDLTSHVQRIFLARKSGSQDALYGTLIDLFIALRGKGKELRRRLLDILKNDLTNAQRTTLEKGEIDKSEAGEYPAWLRYSRLYHPCIADIEIVTPLDRTERTYHTDVLEQARDLIDCGAIDTARQILEQALQTGEQNAAIHHELLNLYRHTRDHEKFLAMWTQMVGLPVSLQESWKALDEYLTRSKLELSHHG